MHEEHRGEPIRDRTGKGDRRPADIWIPPGKWLPWNASAEISGGASGVVLKAQQFALNEIPLFARAGAVVPTQTMRKEDGPLVWILFPGAAGNGSTYHDDGNTTRYQTSDGVSWAHLAHATAGGTTTITVTVQTTVPDQEQLLDTIAEEQGRIEGAHEASDPMSTSMP